MHLNLCVPISGLADLIHSINKMIHCEKDPHPGTCLLPIHPTTPPPVPGPWRGIPVSCWAHCPQAGLEGGLSLYDGPTSKTRNPISQSPEELACDSANLDVPGSGAEKGSGISTPVGPGSTYHKHLYPPPNIHTCTFTHGHTRTHTLMTNSLQGKTWKK